MKSALAALLQITRRHHEFRRKSMTMSGGSVYEVLPLTVGVSI